MERRILDPHKSGNPVEPHVFSFGDPDLAPAMVSGELVQERVDDYYAEDFEVYRWIEDTIAHYSLPFILRRSGTLGEYIAIPALTLPARPDTATAFTLIRRMFSSVKNVEQFTSLVVYVEPVDPGNLVHAVLLAEHEASTPMEEE